MSFNIFYVVEMSAM